MAPRRVAEARRTSVLSTTVLDRALIEQSGARDAAEVLSSAAGVQVDGSFAGAGIRLQGLEPQHALVLIDGERLVGARDGVLDLTRIYASDIEQIEIVRGPASAAYGSDAMAGVVNIVTRPPSARVSALGQARYGATRGSPRFMRGLGHHGDGWASATGGGKRVRLRGSAGYRRVAAFDRTPETPSQSSGRVDSYAGSARLDWLAHERVRVPVLVRAARREERVIDESAGGAVFDRVQRTHDATLTVAPSFRFGSERELSLSASYAVQRAEYLRDQRRDDDGDRYEDAREQLLTVRAQGRRPLGPSLALSSGVELLGQRYSSPRLSERGQRGRVSPYAELLLRPCPHERCLIAPSARVDVDSQYGTSVAPRLAVRWDALSVLTLRGALGRGLRAPSFSELLLDFQNAAASYRVRGNPALRPESSLGASVGVALRARDRVRAELSLYRNELRDLIDTALVEVLGGEQQYAYVNVRRARTQGLESELSASDGDWLTVALTYTLTAARDLTADRPLAGRALHRGGARVVVGGGRHALTASARCQLVGKRRFYVGDAARGFDAPRYVVVDARVAYRVGERFEPFVSGENLTDASGPSLPLRPLSLYAGLNLSY